MFDVVDDFEKQIAEFFGSPYAVATDCCTHAIELCLRLLKPNFIEIPTQTYVSIPMTAIKTNQNWQWKKEKWKNFYYLSENVIDAAVLWERNGYIKNTYMCISFQKAKHLSLGRGGMILTDNLENANKLRSMSYDGRLRHQRWIHQNIDTLGYHYYMTPEVAQKGLDLLPDAIKNIPTIWSYKNYPDISKFKVFDEKNLFK